MGHYSEKIFKWSKIGKYNDKDISDLLDMKKHGLLSKKYITGALVNEGHEITAKALREAYDVIDPIFDDSNLVKKCSWYRY